MRELHVRWMIAGHGGYDEHRITLKIPSLYDVLVIATLLSLLWEAWQLWRN